MSRLLCAAVAGAMLLSVGLAHAADDPPTKGRAGFNFYPERLFKRIDADGVGKITLDEFKAVFSQFPRLADKPEIIEKLFDKLDADGDGKITLDEFKKITELREKIQELREKMKEDK